MSLAAVGRVAASGKIDDCAKNLRCRTCLSKNRDMVPMSTQVPFENHSESYWDCLRHCTGLSIPSKGLGGYIMPEQICLRCSKALEVATHFVQMAKDSEKKLNAEAETKMKLPTNCVTKLELKRKAEDLYDDQFCQQFTKFVQNYEPVIEENVLYMRGAKMPRFEIPNDAENHTSNDVILFDVIYDNTMDEDNENDVSDTKNNETFFEASEMPDDEEDSCDGIKKTDAEEDEQDVNKINNNNNDDKEVNNNTNLPALTSNNADLIEKALLLACSDTNSPEETNVETFEQIKANLLKSLENCSVSEPSEQLEADKNIGDSIEVVMPQKIMIPKIESLPQTIGQSNIYDVGLPAQLLSDVAPPTEADSNALSASHSIDSLLMSYRCRSCNNYTNNNKEAMCAHLKQHHKIETNFELFYTEYQLCGECKRVFKDQKSFRTHYTRMHIGGQTNKREFNEIYKCDKCDKTFNMKSSLQAHERYCKIKEPVSCTFCTKKFNSVRNYETHLQREHAVSTVHECEVCGNIFKNADSLAMHRKRHIERNYQCDECPLNYVNATELKVHVERTHVHHQHVNCGQCGMQFQNRSLLREHAQRSHQKKLWRCETCNFEAISRTRLRQHQYEHTGYPYKCDICDEEFAERNKIRQHSKKLHSIELSDEQLADMFRERLGYTSRQDAFSKANALEIPGFSDDCFDHLKELGLDYDDITSDLFSNNNIFDNLWI